MCGMALTSSLMAPLWIMHPDIPAGSIGWRMGAGEDYWDQWGAWYDDLSATDQAEYQELFPEPLTWAGFYSSDDGMWNRDDEGDYYLNGAGTSFVVHWRKHGRPRYTRQDLIDAAPAPADYVFFWKPEPGVVGPASLSQWQPSRFRWSGTYSCAEQYMMAEKARLFGDDAVAAQIMATDDPTQMKALGRRASGFDKALWDEAKYSIVLAGNYAKFTQNRDLRDYLLSTGDAVLVEASPLDVIWGIGLSESNGKARDPRVWRGRNLLGFALMEVRDEIRRVWANVGLLNVDQVRTARR